MIPTAYKAMAALVVLAACAAFGMKLEHTYRSALIEAQAAKQDADNMRSRLSERDTALSMWHDRQRRWEAERRISTAAIEAKTKEAAESAAKLANRQKVTRDAVKTLPPIERDCAMRVVPVSVDWMLAGQGSTTATADH